MLPRKSLFITGTICGVLSAFLIGALFIGGIINRSSGLTAEQKQAILEAIIKNNSASLFNRNQSATPTSSGLAADAASSFAPLILRPNPTDYTYRHSTVILESGPAATTCKIFTSSTTQPYSTESFDFYGDNNSYNSKQISKDKNGNLIDYYLNNSTATTSESISYKGGSYAAKTSYDYSRVQNFNGATSLEVAPDAATKPDEPTPTGAPEDNSSSVSSEPSDTTTVDTNDVITQYFGPDADIVDTVTKNGKTYYILQYSYQTNCNQDMKYLPLLDSVTSNYSTQSTSDKIIVQNLVDSTTFEVISNSNYLTSVSTANLLNSYTTTIETNNSTFDQVSDKFTFEYDVPVKTIVYSNYDPSKEAQNVIDYLSKNSMTLLLLDLSGAKLQSAYSIPASQDANIDTNYFYDRNFYPSGSLGDQMFNEAKGTTNGYIYSNLTLSYLFTQSTNDYYIGVDVYPSSADETKLLPVASDNVTIQDFNLDVDGTTLTAKLYTTKYETFAKEPIAPNQSEPSIISQPSYSTKQVYVEYKGFKFVILMPTQDNFDLSTLKFKSISTSNSAQMSSLGEDIKSAYNNIYNGAGTSGSSGRGTSTPGSEPTTIVEPTR